MIGVLAVIALLVAAIVPVAIRHIDQAALAREQKDLGDIAQSLTNIILRTGSVPGWTNWDRAVAQDLAQPVSSINTTPRHLTRVFLMDPSGWLSSVAGGHTWTQTSAGTIQPTNARVAIVSTIARAFPISSGMPSASEFNAVWNAPDHTTPSSSVWNNWASAGGRGDDLVIQRLSLDGLFHRIILNPIDTNYFGSMAVEMNGAVGATNVITGVSNAWYLKSTVVRFYDTNSDLSIFTLESKSILQNDTSLVFENKMWRGQLSGWGTNGPAGPSSSSSSGPWQGFVALAQVFTNGVYNPNAANGATPMEVLRAFYELMNNYNFWVREGFVASQDTAWNILNADEPEFARAIDDSTK